MPAPVRRLVLLDDIPQLQPDEAAARMAEGAVMVDVREQEERAQARIPGTLFIPLSQLQRRWQELPRKPLILQCAAGARSHQAARFLAGHDFEVANLASGITGWYRTGHPVDTDPE